MSEFDIENILDCIINSHELTQIQRDYIETLLPTKPENESKGFEVELFEAIDDKTLYPSPRLKFCLVFRSVQEAKSFYFEVNKKQQYREQISSNRLLIAENVAFAFLLRARRLSRYTDFIQQFISVQPVAIFSFTLFQRDIELASNLSFYYKVHWAHKRTIPRSQLAMKKEFNVRAYIIKKQDENYEFDSDEERYFQEQQEGQTQYTYEQEPRKRGRAKTISQRRYLLLPVKQENE